jgi:uncharacterized membrane protein
LRSCQDRLARRPLDDTTAPSLPRRSAAPRRSPVGTRCPRPGWPARVAVACAFVALAPLALGSVVLTRFDHWPAALVAGALALLLAGRGRLSLGVLGFAIAAKVYPLVLLPLFAAWVWRRRGRREALIALGVAGGVVAVFVVPSSR